MERAKPVKMKLIAFPPELIDQMESKEPNTPFTQITIKACEEYIKK